MRGVRERLRPWMERLVLLVAAVSVLATSKGPRWRITATAPGASPTARVLTVEASAQPQLLANSAAGRGGVLAWKGQTFASPWPGRADYLVLPGWDVTLVELEGPCSGGGCGRAPPPCVPPPGAFLRVVAVTPVESWTLSADATVTTPPGKYEVRVEASRAPDIAAIPVPGPAAVPGVAGVYDTSEGHVTPPSYSFQVEWAAPGSPPSFAWTARAVIGDECPSPTTPCTAPAGETVRIAPIVRAK
jgi:hypothetical protein